MKEIPLSRGLKALVDDEDYAQLSAGNWFASDGKRGFYAMRSVCINSRYKSIPMHRLLVDIPIGMQVDHINHNTLDNRKCNLRVCTIIQNQANSRRHKQNTSGFKGVCREGNGWRAQIHSTGQQIYLGHFAAPEAAARAYDQAALKQWGEFAYLNFPPSTGKLWEPKQPITRCNID